MSRSDLDLEILRTIVSPIPVNVMHHFMWQEKPSEHPLHDEAVFHYVASLGSGRMLRREDANVPVERHAAAFPSCRRPPWPSSGRMGRNAIGFQDALNDRASQAEPPSDRALARLIDRQIGLTDLRLRFRYDRYSILTTSARALAPTHPALRPGSDPISAKYIQHTIRMDVVPTGDKRGRRVRLQVGSADLCFEVRGNSHGRNLSRSAPINKHISQEESERCQSF